VIRNAAAAAFAATVTEDGVVNNELLSDSVTVVPPVGAAELSVTVQVLVPLELTVVGLHASDDNVTGGASVTVAVFETPLSVAVTVTLPLLVMVPAVTVNVAVVAFAATVTEDGVVNNELLSDSVTVVPPVGAAELSVTVHVLVPLELTVVGLHASDDNVTGGASVTVAVFETPLSVAVTVTLPLLVMVPAVTVNVAVVAFAATVTDDGVVNNELLSDSVTVVPPVGAAELSVTVQDALPALLSVVGEQANEVSDGVTVVPVIVPPVAASDKAVPDGDAPMPLLMAIDVELTPVGIVTFTDATTPLAMMLEFKPDARHVYVPVPLTQVSVLPALVRAAPAVAEMVVTFADVNVNVH